jgi:hypothetical protein
MPSVKLSLFVGHESDSRIKATRSEISNKIHAQQDLELTVKQAFSASEKTMILGTEAWDCGMMASLITKCGAIFDSGRLDARTT